MNIEIEIKADSTEHLKESLGAVVEAFIKDSDKIQELKINVNFQKVNFKVIKPPPRGIPSESECRSIFCL